MNREKAIAYSLLAHIRNNASLIDGPLDIFVPLIKRAISQMNSDKIFNGQSINEINEYSKKLYSIDFPLAVLRSILDIIVAEVRESNQGAFFLHDDNSFSIANYTFTEFDETIRKRNLEVKKLEELFQDFCGNSKIDIKDTSSIFNFLENNKLSLGKHLSNTESTNGHDYTIEAQFVNYFKEIPVVYELLKNLYLGSMLSEYIEYSPTDIDMNVELLLDTNFIISLIDLNTIDSTRTCNTLIEIVKGQGYKLTILQETIDEIKFLLQRKAENLNKTFMVKKIYAEDIYNACDRRNLTKIDLERIIDNIDKEITSYGIDKATGIDEIIKKALESDEYTYYKEKRTSEVSARHDVIALYYVKSKRGNTKIKSFSDVNCWFVNNAITRGYTRNSYEKSYQPEIIKADDLLSILWLSNPKVSNLIASDKMADIGLSSLVSLTFTESLPKTAIIKEFEDNIQKYGQDNISTQDIIRVATRIADKQLTNVEELNKLANEDHEQFVKKLEEESQKQLELESSRVEALAKIVEKFEVELDNIEKIKKSEKEKTHTISSLSGDNSDKEQEIIRLKKEIEKNNLEKKQKTINKKINIWQRNSRLMLLGIFGISLIGMTYILLYSPLLLEKTYMKVLIMPFFGLCIAYSLKLAYDRHLNHSNMTNYKKTLE